jgi:hypothetical protein
MNIFFLVPKLQLGNLLSGQALLGSKAAFQVDMLIAKLELGANMRPQAGAWGREGNRRLGVKDLF